VQIELFQSEMCATITIFVHSIQPSRYNYVYTGQTALSGDTSQYTVMKPIGSLTLKAFPGWHVLQLVAELRARLILLPFLVKII
jgi:hypothetical protein